MHDLLGDLSLEKLSSLFDLLFPLFVGVFFIRQYTNNIVIIHPVKHQTFKANMPKSTMVSLMIVCVVMSMIFERR